MKIGIVEPHPDDAYLSLGHHLEKLWTEHELTIITVFCNEKRAKEAQAYADKIKVSSIVLGLEESPMDGNTRPGIITPLKLTLEAQKFDQLVFPLGLQHPDHRSVAATRTPGCWRYVDTPYQCKQKVQEELRTKLDGREIVSVAYPTKVKWRHIPIFKSQSKFFYFNDMEAYAPCELIVK